MGRARAGPDPRPGPGVRHPHVQDLHQGRPDPRLPGPPERTSPASSRRCRRPTPPTSGTLLGKVVALTRRRCPLDGPWTARRTRSRSTARPSRPASSPTPAPPAPASCFDLATKAIFAADPRDVSLLHALFYFHSGNGDPQPREHRRRRAGLALRRRLAARLDPDGGAARRARRARRAGAAHRSRQGAGGDRRPAIAGTLAGAARDRRHGADARGPDRLRTRRCRRCATGSPSGCRRARRSSTRPSIAKPFWRADGPQRLHQQRPLAGRLHLRQLAAQRRRRACCSGS